MRDTASWSTFGLRGPRPEVDLGAVLANANRVANYACEKKNLADVVRRSGVELIEGSGPATFRDTHTVALADGRTWQAERCVIAVGGHGRKLSIPGGELALTYDDVRGLQQLPASVAVIGAADTGCQLASIFEDFGCRVTVLEAGPRLHPRADEDISAGLEAAFRQQGIDVITSATTERLEPVMGGIGLQYRQAERQKSLTVDAVLCAVGWPANTEPLSLASVGVETDRGYIPVNDYLQTNVPHVFAAGDVNGRSMLVQSASYEGRLAAENAVIGPHRQLLHEIVPSGGFTDPEYASVGLTEAEARQHYDCAVSTIRYDVVARAVIDGRADGFCKLIVDRGQRHIVGAHVLGEYSAEVIQVVAACMAGGMRVEQVAEIQFAYPTFAEAIGLAARRLALELGVIPVAPEWSSLAPLPIQDRPAR
jgi:dihydrolipoamide dehydrogenase